LQLNYRAGQRCPSRLAAPDEPRNGRLDNKATSLLPLLD
jgi:hypothetical protein